MERKITTGNGCAHKKSISLMVDATNRCQLECRYCYFGQKRGDVMDPKKTAAAIRNVTVATGAKNINLHYMGGEPLLAWDEIRALNALTRDWCKDNDVTFEKWGATSNLVALDQAKTEVMVKEKASIHCSIDGPARIHDKNRPQCGGQGSYDRVIKNIPFALSITPRDVARVTVMPENAGDLVEITRTILDLGFQTVGLFPTYEPEWSDEQVTTWAQNLVLAYEVSKKNGRARIHTIVRDKRKDKKSGDFGYCGAGKGLWALDALGKVYHCHHFTNFPHLSIIDATNSSPEEISKAMSTSTLPPFGKPLNSTCSSCNMQKFCNGMCWANNFLTNGDSSLPVRNECRLFIASHTLLWPVMEPDLLKQEKMRACGRCDECQSCYTCDACDTSCQSGCEQSCQICVSGCQESCQRTCQSRCEDRCQDSCEHSCQDCQTRCEQRCERCNNSCEGCEHNGDCANCDCRSDF